MKKQMRRIHTFVSESDWERANEEGVLKADFEIWREDRDLLRDVKALMTEDESRDYLVGMPYGVIQSWRKQDALWVLNQNVCGGTHPDANRAVRLSVPILETDGAFVRERKYIAPGYSNSVERQVGVRSMNQGRSLGSIDAEIWSEGRSSGMNEASKQQHKIWSLLCFQYQNSAVALRDYEAGQFEVPEVWLPQDTPVDRIKVIATLDQIK